MLEKLKKLDNRYTIDLKEHEVLINPKQPIQKKYNLKVKLDKKIYYFKGNGIFSYDRSELLCNQIANQVGLKTINPVPAYYVNEKENYIEGILSKDYIEDRKGIEIITGYQLLSLYVNMIKSKKFDIHHFFKKKINKEETINLRIHNNLQTYQKSLKVFQKALQDFNPNFKLEIDDDLIYDLCKYQVFYFATCNEDCYAHNVEFVLTKTSENTIKIGLAPLTDNSISLLIKSFKFDHNDLEPSISDDKLNTIVKSVMSKIRMPFSVFEKQTENYRRDRIAIEIAKLMNINPKLKDFYLQLKSINPSELFNSYKEKNGYDFIDNFDIRVASMAYNNSIKELENGLEYCRLFCHQDKKVESNVELQKE